MTAPDGQVVVVSGLVPPLLLLLQPLLLPAASGGLRASCVGQLRQKWLHTPAPSPQSPG